MTTDPLVVTRSFPLSGAEAGPVAAALKDVGGVQDVHPAGGSLVVTYDIRHLRLADVERVMAGAGAAPARGLVAGIKRGLASFTEENKLASVRAEVRPCCSRPPK